MLRKIGYFILALLLLLGVISYIFIQNNKPHYKGTISINSLDDPVSVYFDDFGIPHIFADNEIDAQRALGYVHAQDRLWQMELMRRVTAGRLSEIFGKELVKTDKLFRGLGIEKASEKTIEELDKTSQPYLLAMAYLEGINQFIDEGQTPIEFKILGVEKEHYSLKDIYSVYGYMAFSFAHAHKTDPLLSALKDKLGAPYLKDLDINSNPRTIMIRNSRGMKRMVHNMGRHVSEIMDAIPVPPLIGSNGWVIGPQRTAKGKVLFANDPHIAFSQPSVWYQAHIITPKSEMYGFYLALSPFPVLGHNYDYAYGITMFENDDTDFYAENAEQKYAIREEVIKVKNEDDIRFEVRTGEHGPVMNDLIETIGREDKITMDWIYTKFDNELLQAAYEISHAGSLQEFKDGASRVIAPGLNFMYGDARGNIAWFAAAKLYERPEGVNSKFILDGSNGVDDQVSYIDFENNPQAINPSWHYVYSANNQPEEVNGKLYPGYYLPEDRARRVVKLIESQDTISASYSESMINDVESSMAPKLVKIMLNNISIVNLNENEKEALVILKDWKGDYRSDLSAPTIYYKFVYLFLKNTFEDEMGEDLFKQFLNTHLYKRQLNKQMSLNRSVWWDDIKTKEVKELKDEIFTRSFHESIAALESQFGNDLDDWQWSKALSVTHKHAFDKSATLSGFFNVGPFSTDGGIEVLNNQLFKLNSSGNYEVIAGPSTRRVIDFSDVENAKAIIPTGQSGNVFSKHYKDQTEKYLNGEFIKMMMNKEEIKASKDILVLLPKNDSID